jgi:hypothetical protein
MAFAQRKQPVRDLGGEILRLRGEIESFIDAKVAEVKRSESGRDLPIDSLRHMLTRGDSCLCRAAMHILAEEQS